MNSSGPPFPEVTTTTSPLPESSRGETASCCAADKQEVRAPIPHCVFEKGSSVLFLKCCAILVRNYATYRRQMFTWCGELRFLAIGEGNGTTRG